MQRKLNILLSAIFIFILIAAGNSAEAANIDIPLQKAIRSLSQNDEVPVIITLSGKANIAAIHEKDRKTRKTRIIGELRQRAEISQRNLRGVLEARGARKVKPFWIVNGISATIPVSFLAELSAIAEVESIQMDYPIELPATSVGISALPEWNIAAVHAPDVWNIGYAGAGAVVANMDTGVDLSHPDLQSKWRGGANSWYDPNGEHGTPYDANGHGTQTMGIMVGGTYGGTAIGIAPDARWIAVKLFNDAGVASLSKVHDAFQWLLDPDDNPATDDAPDVVNASWGLLGSSGQCVADFQTDIQNLNAAGIAVVFSGGNAGPQLHTSESPANNPGSFAVGATDTNDLIASFSSRGPSACGGGTFPHVTAPGVNVRTSDLTGGGVFQNSYAYVSGTSFAAPHVAGAIALLLSAFPGKTPEQIESALEQTASDFGAPGSDNEYGFGFINILNAYTLLLASSSGPVIEVLPISHDFGSVEISSVSLSYIFQVTNKGDRNLDVGAITLTGTNASEFRISVDNCSGRTFTPQEVCTLEAIFSPTTGGSKNASLLISSNDPDRPAVTVSLTGTGFVPPLRVLSPNGGEKWPAGTTAVIRWNYTGNPGYGIKIELLRAGALNKTITSYASAGSGGNGSYTWMIPSNLTPDTSYQIRVTSTTNATYQDVSNTYFTITAPPPPSVSVTTPNGGESLNAGTTNTIRWSFTGTPGAYVKIELYRGSQINRIISSYAPIGSNGSGVFNWTIPSTQAADSDYRIKVTSATNSSYNDISDAVFAINAPPPPIFTLATPNGGETWKKGTGQTIRWTYAGNAGSYLKIELLKGGSVNRIISSYARLGSGGTGSYYWYIPSNQASGNDYQIRITSTSNSSVADIGNGFFTIQ